MFNNIFNRSILLCLICVACMHFSGTESVAQTRWDFFNGEETSARTYALGGATLADYHDVTNMSLNPATLIYNENPQSIVISSDQNWSNNIASEYIDIPVFKNSLHAIAAGFSVQNNGLGGLRYIDSSPITKLDLRRIQLSAGYALAVTPKLSVGIRGNLIRGWNRFQIAWAGNLDIGVLYAPTSSVSYAIAFRDIGPDIWYHNDFDDTTILRGDWATPKTLELGATMTFPENADSHFLSVSLGNKKIFGEDGLIYKGGLEIKPINKLAIRTGYVRGINERGFRFGLGVITELVRIDYGLSPIANTMGGHHFSATINF